MGVTWFDFRVDSKICRECATTDQGAPDMYSTKQFRDRAVDKVNEHAALYAGKPMFLYLPFQAVHAPLMSSPFWQKQFNLSDFGGDKDRFTYVAMVLARDPSPLATCGLDNVPYYV